MKTARVEIVILHEAKTTPEEIQKLYTDYGHEWVFHKGVFVSRKYDASHYEILSPHEHRLAVTLAVLGVIRLRFLQSVSVVPGVRIASEGRNIFGYSLGSVWELKKIEGGMTRVRAVYSVELPWFLGFLSAPLKWFLKEMRRKSWIKDRLMLERRSELLGLGFGDGGKHPEDRWLPKAASSPIPQGAA